MSPRFFFVICVSAIAVITSGCITYQHKTVYKDSDVKVIFHQPLSFAFDATPPSYMELTIAGHSYKLADCIDGAEGGCKGFLKTPDGNAIVFIENYNDEVMQGTLHVVNLKTKLDVAVILNFKWLSYNPKFSISSYDGHRLMLFVNPMGSGEIGGNMEIDLDTKQAKFDRITNSISRPFP